MEKKNLLQPFKFLSDFFKSSLSYDESYDKRTLGRIEKAWIEGSGFDHIGYIWVDADQLDVILRTTKKNAKVLADSVRDQERQWVGKKLYIYGPAVSKLLSKSVGMASTKTKRRYLKVSTDHYHEIEFSDAAEGIRTDFQEAMRKARKSMKRQRIKNFSVTEDELTGEPLDLSTAEFSHIRSAHIYPDLAMELENGLIVNQSTHREITKNDITQEDELYEHCLEAGWRTDWKPEYDEWLQAVERWKEELRREAERALEEQE